MGGLIRGTRPNRGSGLEAVARVAGLVDVHHPGVEPQRASMALEMSSGAAGDDQLQRELVGGLRDGV
jgi:hypothetical protein